MKRFLTNRWFHPLLLLVWIAIGAGLRFTHLSGKPPWTDEFATLVFSLGHGYKTIPLDQAISLETLLQPLQIHPVTGANGVLHHLLTEDHHPPLYFVLAHWWIQLFPSSGEYVSLWVARLLPALLGVISIPALYGLGWLAFRSRLVAQLTAAMMAVSPYSIFLSQEARHYALALLWVIASLCCLVVAVQHLQRRTPLPIWVALCWVIVNSLGMATHYFVSLTLLAEAMVLMGFLILGSPWGQRLKSILPIPLQSWATTGITMTSHSHWWRIYAVAAGTLAGCLVWVPVWQASASEEMTQWIKVDNPTILTFIGPPFQALATWITMVSLLPVEASSLLVVIASGAVMLVFFIWATPIVSRNLKVLVRQPDTGLAMGALGGFVLGAIAIFFGITYILGTDLTRGARYNFVYFPAVIGLVGAALAVSWKASDRMSDHNKVALPQASRVSSLSNPSLSHQQFNTNLEAQFQQETQGSLAIRPHASHSKIPGKLAVAMIWFMGLLSGITVVSNLGYQKYYRPDLLVPGIRQASSVPVLIATTHNTLVQTGEMMGIAWEFQRTIDGSTLPINPQFLLAHQAQDKCEGTGCRASTTLHQTLAQLPRPLDLWLVNFKAPVEQDIPNCFAEDTSQYPTSVDGYSSRLYHCLSADSQVSGRMGDG
ncbi:MAG TPA: glycosyltransferase [Coleofasciculaceae cyanobacterium]